MNRSVLIKRLANTKWSELPDEVLAQIAEIVRVAEKTKLLPCPFCGRSDVKLEDHRTIWVVRCECSACVLGERAPEPESEMPDKYWSYYEQSAIDAWNRRAHNAELRRARPEL